jgi:hypothetical protein
MALMHFDGPGADGETASDVAKAEAEVEVEVEVEVEKAIEEIEHPRKFTVKVLYNGVVKTFEVRPEETVKQLLDEAIRVFGAASPHTLSLYKGGTELADGQTLKEAGVEPNDQLLLRPGAVSLPAQGGQRRPLQKFNRTRDIP